MFCSIGGCRAFNGIVSYSNSCLNTLNRCVANIIHKYHQTNASLQDVFQMLKISSDIPDASNDSLAIKNNFVALSACKWRQSDKKERVQENMDGSERSGDVSETDIILNLRQFTVDQNLVFQKNGYDKNIRLIKITENDLRLRQAVDIVQTTINLQVTHFCT